MTTSIKQEKEAFITRQLRSGERTGEYLERELRKAFPGQVTARFRNEVEGLIKRRTVIREGVGATAVFKLTKGTAGKRPAVKKPVASARTKPSPVPKVQKVEVEELNEDQVKALVPVLTYFAKNGERLLSTALRKSGIEMSITLASALTIAYKRRLFTEGAANGTFVIAKEGYRCLDVVHAGETYR